MGQNIPITGQLFLIDLIEKLEPHMELIQTNTDGILIQADINTFINTIKPIVKDWEKRSRFTMGFDYYQKVFQRDVNNYVFQELGGKIKTKGKMVKFYNEPSNFNRQFRVVSLAVVNNLIYGIPVEQTVKDVKDIKDYMYVAKATHKYSEVASFRNGEYVSKELKTNRLFPTTSPNGVEVKKYNGTYNRFPDAPSNGFIWNKDLSKISTPEIAKKFLSAIKVDWNYYIDLANKELERYGR